MNRLMSKEQNPYTKIQQTPRNGMYGLSSFTWQCAMVGMICPIYNSNEQTQQCKSTNQWCDSNFASLHFSHLHLFQWFSLLGILYCQSLLDQSLELETFSTGYCFTQVILSNVLNWSSRPAPINWFCVAYFSFAYQLYFVSYVHISLCKLTKLMNNVCQCHITQCNQNS